MSHLTPGRSNHRLRLAARSAVFHGRHPAGFVGFLLSLALLGACAGPVGLQPAPATARPLAAAPTPRVDPEFPPVSRQAEGFGIYLTADDLSVQQVAGLDLAQVRPAGSPVVSLQDVEVYLASRHEMVLTPAAYQRLSALLVPVPGRPFLVCVDRRPIYWGAFWTPLSSASFSGVVIMQPLPGISRTIRIELGYPSVQDFQGQDPRSAAPIIEALAHAGKLG